jgi:hypothetical protein
MKDDYMGSEFIVTKALAAGAVATQRPNLGGRHEALTEIADAYQALKGMIASQYGQIDVDLLDIGPGSAERQKIITQQLEEAGANDNEAILRQAQLVLDIIAEENPESLWASDTPQSPPHRR